MIFYYNLNGEVVDLTATEIYQGSNKANSIFVVAPFPASSVVTVMAKLPNGEILQPILLELKNQFVSEFTDDLGNGLSVWGFDVPYSITKNCGYVKLQFAFTSSTETITTSTAQVLIKKGVNTIPVELTDEDVYDEILSLVSSMNENIADYVAPKLDKVTTSSTNKKVYAKAENGTQEMLDVSESGASNIVLRKSNGNITTVTPLTNSDATTKQYVDEKVSSSLSPKLDKATTRTYHKQVYAKAEDGTQEMLDVSENGASSIVFRKESGAITAGNTLVNSDAASKRYVDEKILLDLLTKIDKNNTTTTKKQVYAKTEAGFQTMLDVSESGPYNIVLRKVNGNITTGTPLINSDATTKQYVDEEISSLSSTKVDKVNGKGLSTNDYTDNDKQKLGGIEAGAEVNEIDEIIAGTNVSVTKQGKQVTISATSSSSEQSYELIEKIIVGYSVLESEPEDWEENFSSYYKTNGKEANDLAFNYVQLTQAEEFEIGKYYSFDNSTSIKINITKEPNGRTYSFDKMRLFILYKNGSSNDGYTYYAPGLYANYSFITANKDGTAFFEVEIDKSSRTVFTKGGNGQYNPYYFCSSMASGMSRFNDIKANNINRISLGALLYPLSEVYIYAVRA